MLLGSRRDARRAPPSLASNTPSAPPVSADSSLLMVKTVNMRNLNLHMLTKWHAQQVSVECGRILSLCVRFVTMDVGSKTTTEEHFIDLHVSSWFAVAFVMHGVAYFGNRGMLLSRRS